MATTQQPQAEFVKALSRLDATALVVGSMIGSGIFIVSAEMLREVHAPGLLLVVWAASGIVTLMGALTYGELAAMFPRAGGQYVYLREAISPLFGYLYGWTLFVVIQTGTIAAVAVAFARFTSVFWPGLSPQRILAVLSVALLTWINVRGVRTAALIQTSLTAIKTGALALLILLGVTIGRNGRLTVLDGRVEQRRIRRQRAQERPARPPGGHGGGRVDRDGPLCARERRLPERAARGRDRRRAAGPRRHRGAPGHPGRARLETDGRGDHDLDVRLQQRPHPVRSTRVLRHGAGRPVLQVGRRAASRIQDPGGRPRRPSGMDESAVPFGDVHAASELRHLRGAGVLRADGGGLVCAAHQAPRGRPTGPRPGLSLAAGAVRDRDRGHRRRPAGTGRHAYLQLPRPRPRADRRARILRMARHGPGT